MLRLSVAPSRRGPRARDTWLVLTLGYSFANDLPIRQLEPPALPPALRPSDSTIRGLCAEPKSAIRSAHGCSKVVRKSIARVNTVHNQKVKQALRVNYKDAKCDPPFAMPLTRAIPTCCKH